MSRTSTHDQMSAHTSASTQDQTSADLSAHTSVQKAVEHHRSPILSLSDSDEDDVILPSKKKKHNECNTLQEIIEFLNSIKFHIPHIHYWR